MVPILEKHEIKTAYLVTNAWHMPRAMYAFHSVLKITKNTEIKVIAAPMGYVVLPPNQGILNYLPSFSALDTSATALHEYVGMVWYRLRNLFLPRISR